MKLIVAAIVAFLAISSTAFAYGYGGFSMSIGSSYRPAYYGGYSNVYVGSYMPYYRSYSGYSVYAPVYTPVYHYNPPRFGSSFWYSNW